MYFKLDEATQKIKEEIPKEVDNSGARLHKVHAHSALELT